jgi:hypothetical protein
VSDELVARGAERAVATLSVPALLMGMVVTPPTIELEEVMWLSATPGCGNGRDGPAHHR